MKMPVLRRRDTREEFIHKIDQIIALNEELQKNIKVSEHIVTHRSNTG